MRKQLSIPELKRRMAEVTDTQLLSTEYVSNRAPLRFRCSCGNVFERCWNSFYDQKAYKCFECATRDAYRAKRLTEEQIYERLFDYGVTWLSGEYKNQRSRLHVRFSCGHEGDLCFNSTYAESFSGLCPSCAQRDGLTLDLATVAFLGEVRYGIELLSTEYTGSQVPLRWRCACGNEFTACWNNVTFGQVQCADCSGKTSRGERLVQLWLDGHGVAYEREFKFPDCADKKPFPFDFYLPKQNICIEVDGYQHYRPVEFWGQDAETYARIRAHDALKTSYCEAKGITLVRIPYTELQRVDEILADKIIPR